MTVHYALTGPEFQHCLDGISPACGSMTMAEDVTIEHDKVTCRKCQQVLEYTRLLGEATRQLLDTCVHADALCCHCGALDEDDDTKHEADCPVGVLVDAISVLATREGWA